MFRDRKRGFSLVEALVSVVITAVGVAAALKGIASLTLAQAQSLERARMADLAIHKLDELIATDQTTDVGGDFQDIGESRYTWESLVTSTTQADLSQFKVTVSKVNQADNGVQEVVTVLHYVPPQGTTTTP